MSYVFQFCRILAVCLLGELLAWLLPLPVPSSVYGLILMLVALKLGVFRLDQVKETGGFLTGILPLLFVPAAVGVMDLWVELQAMLLSCVIAVGPVTLLVMAVSGWVTQAARRILQRGARHMSDFLSGSAVWGTALTIGAFALGAIINRKTGKAWCNPLLLGSLFVIVLLSCLQIPYENYKSSAAPVSYLLLPATVSLAIPLYEKWTLLKRNAVAIASGILSGVLTSLGSITVMAWLLKLETTQTATLLPKSVTTAIGMDVASALGGMPPLAGAVIILTGIMGNLTAQGVCSVLKVTDPIARGIAIGSASHAIGTAKALEMGEVEGAMSSLAVALAGVLTAVLAPVFVKLI